MTHVELQSGPEGLDRPRKRIYWKSSFLRDLSDPVLERCLESTIDANEGRRLAAAEMLSMGGAIGRVAEDASAYSRRDASVDFLAVAGWTDLHQDDDRLAAARRIWEEIAGRDAYGVYVNNLGDEGQDLVREACGDAKYRRLMEIKARYDPDNVFRHTSNIRPKA